MKLNQLNAQQREAVELIGGPILIFAVLVVEKREFLPIKLPI